MTLPYRMTAEKLLFSNKSILYTSVRQNILIYYENRQLNLVLHVDLDTNQAIYTMAYLFVMMIIFPLCASPQYLTTTHS